MKNVKYIILGVTCLLSFYGGYKYADTTVQTEIRETEVEKILWKERVVTVIKERPDGSKETTVTEDREKEAETDKAKVVKISKPKWSATINVGISPVAERAKPVYGLIIHRRIIGDFFFGAYVRSDSEIGASFRYDF